MRLWDTGWQTAGFGLYREFTPLRKIAKNAFWIFARDGAVRSARGFV